MLELILDSHVKVHGNGVQLLAGRGLLDQLHLMLYRHQIWLLLLLKDQLLLLLLLLLRHAPLLDHAMLFPLVNVQGLLAGAHLAANVTLKLDAMDDQVSGTRTGPKLRYGTATVT